jgi:hypothetical protein
MEPRSKAALPITEPCTRKTTPQAIQAKLKVINGINRNLFFIYAPLLFLFEQNRYGQIRTIIYNEKNASIYYGKWQMSNISAATSSIFT